MARFIATNILIGRIFRLSSRVAYGGIFHSVDLPEYGFDSPKTSSAKGRFFSAHGFTIKREANRCNRLRLTTMRARQGGRASLCRAAEAAMPM